MFFRRVSTGLSAKSEFDPLLRISCTSFGGKVPGKFPMVNLVSFGISKGAFPSMKAAPRLQICCAAKPETVAKICEIVRSQLALDEKKEVTAESKFAELGADSLDTVEIVMELEEQFGITVNEDSSPSITTVQEAADLIESLVQANGETDEESDSGSESEDEERIKTAQGHKEAPKAAQAGAGAPKK
ncbi:unnamed protein product [Spirodela intermedia]|uniref:Acyl carrier protein n=2 Tax=Spirodela intermedia TaxID=51605 RepID=A0A7I8L3R4_SPIIN|nr:unnamed protein product [Spirodela intermedia]CAA6667833.1 unnamed protein product [Spirodela intermedia]CAA7404653.1 unnamed protein product [Spirodela intermedia]